MIGNNEVEISDGLIPQLPNDVIIEILLRLSSVKTIALCKSVCKSWRGLISDPRFAELHLARSKICILARNTAETLRTLYLLDDEDGRRGFHSGHCICEPGTETESCEICLSDTTAITQLKIPVDVKTIENTCDGLLCLYSFNREYAEDSSIVVCNPVTGEFVTLPKPDHREFSKIRIATCGLGLDPKTGQYKVIMLYPLPIPNSKLYVVLKAAVHVLGTDSWRELDTADAMLELYLDGAARSYPALLNGALYWVYTDLCSGTYGMVSFDLSSERLLHRSLSPPPHHDGVLDVAVLSGRLCVYPFHLNGKLDMLVMDKRSSFSNSSPEWVSHDLSEVQVYLRIICGLDDGALLMNNGRYGNELIYYDPPRGGMRFKRLRFADRDRLEVVTYTPSFISLKDIVRPLNAEVLDVYFHGARIWWSTKLPALLRFVKGLLKYFV